MTIHLLILIYLSYSKTFSSYEGPALPLTVIFAAGSFSSPFYLDYQEDPYIKQIYLFNAKCKYIFK